MNRLRITWRALLAYTMLSGWLVLPVQAQIVVQDDRGQKVVLQAPAQRIISLAPHVTEWLYSLGAGGHIVGASDYSDYPEAAKNIPRVGDYARVDFERLMALKPDLIIAWASGTSEAALAQLHKHGFPVYVSEPRGLEDISRHLINLGRLTGRESSARDLVTGFGRQIEDLRRRHAGRAQISVFYQISAQPLMTVNDQHIITDIIKTCGGQNVFGQLSVIAPTVSREAVLAANPQVIIVASRSAGEEMLDPWRRMPALTAVQRQQLYTIDSNIIHRPTLRIVQGARQMCQAIERARGRG